MKAATAFAKNISLSFKDFSWKFCARGVNIQRNFYTSNYEFKF